VLRAGDHTLTQVLALHPARKRHTHSAHQVGVLAVGLRDATPARVAGDIHHRRERMEHADRPHLAPHDVSHLPHSVRIPRRGQPERRRKRREVRCHYAVERLVVEERRDLQARFGDEISLDRVDAVGDLLRQLVPEQADAGDVSDAVSEQAVHLVPYRAIGAEQRQGND
jgi:hypothetical protein